MAFVVGDNVWFKRAGQTPYVLGDPTDHSIEVGASIGGRGDATVTFTKGQLGLGKNEGVPQITAADLGVALDSADVTINTYPLDGARIGVRASNDVNAPSKTTVTDFPAEFLGTVPESYNFAGGGQTFELSVNGGLQQLATVAAPTKATLTSGAETFSFVAGGQTLNIVVDTEANQPVVFPAGTAASITGTNVAPFDFVAGGQTLIVNPNATGDVTITVAAGVAATLTGSNAGPFDFVAGGQDFVVDVNGSGPQTILVATGTGATVLGSNSPATFNLGAGETLIFTLDTGGAQTFTFAAGDFAVPGSATISEILAVINTGGVTNPGVGITNGTVANDGGALRITSDMIGTASSLTLGAGTANAVLGLAGGPFAGTGDFADYSTVAIASVVAKFNFTDLTEADSGLGELKLTSTQLGNGSSIQIGTGTANSILGFADNALDLGSGDFADYANALITEVATKFNYANVFETSDAGALKLTSGIIGTGSSLVIGAGTANAILGFTAAPAPAGSSVGTGFAANYALATALEVAAVVDAQTTVVVVSTVLGAVKLTSAIFGSDSAVIIGAGTANAILGFTTGQTSLGTGSVPNYAVVTAADAAAYLNVAISGLVCSDSGGAVLITTDLAGPDAELVLGNGTLNAVLGFTDLATTAGSSTTSHAELQTSGVYDDPTALGLVEYSQDEGVVFGSDFATSILNVDPNQIYGRKSGNVALGPGQGTAPAGPSETTPFAPGVIDISMIQYLRTPSGEEGYGTVIEVVSVKIGALLNGVKCGSGRAYWINWGTPNASNHHRTKWNNKMRTQLHAEEELVQA